MARIGFIGLGRMGLPMAKNLVKAGHTVIGHDLDKAAAAALVEAGGTSAASQGAAATGVDAVVTMLPEGRHTLAVYRDAGTLAAATPGTLFVDASSIDVASARTAHELAAKAGMASLDAPVSGGIAGAVNATLTFMCGGEAEAFARAKPILEAMGKRIVHCGGAGAGQAVKMCNQMMVAANMAVAAEAMVLAERLGIEPRIVHEVVTSSSGGSWALQNYCPVPGLSPNAASNNGFKPGFTTALMLKDLKIFQEAARAAGVPSPVGNQVMALYEMFHNRGSDGVDYSGVIEMLRGKPVP